MSLTGTIRGAAVRAFGHCGEVAGLASISPAILRVTVRSDRVRTVELAPGCKVKLHVGDGAMRSYTPAAVDRASGRMDIVVHVHGDSAASRWANAVREGDEVRFVGPGASMPGAGGEVPWAGFYGDESTLGLAERLLGTLPESTPIFGAIEITEVDAIAVEELPLDAVLRHGEHGPALTRHLAGVELPPGPGVVWLSGEASSVLTLRQALLDRGLTREQLRIKPYWSLRGKAHRKELERTVLRA